eukprot:Gb_10767 [translate_table: standard]
MAHGGEVRAREGPKLLAGGRKQNGRTREALQPSILCWNAFGKPRGTRRTHSSYFCLESFRKVGEGSLEFVENTGGSPSREKSVGEVQPPIDKRKTTGNPCKWFGRKL